MPRFIGKETENDQGTVFEESSEDKKNDALVQQARLLIDEILNNDGEQSDEQAETESSQIEDTPKNAA